MILEFIFNVYSVSNQSCAKISGKLIEGGQLLKIATAIFKLHINGMYFKSMTVEFIFNVYSAK